MLKLFRTVRQTLVTENKTAKYLLYALGEIVLVVIGILIALWIDTVYTDRQLQKTERKYLSELRNNLKFDLKDIEFNIDFNENRLRSNVIVLQYLNQEIPYSDSLDFHFSNLVYATRTLPNNSTYETLKSRGLDIITSDSLRQQITTLYDFSIKNLIDFETKEDNNVQYTVLIPEVIKAIEIEKIWGKAKPVDQQAILKNHELKNAILINIQFKNIMINGYTSLKKEVLQTISQIDKFLASE